MTNSTTEEKAEKINKDIKALTFTLVFEGAALNRDEKIGGNIASIKKLNRYGFDGQQRTHSFISRESIRHHLFHTLCQNPDTKWTPSEVTAQNKVVQFDLRKSNILNSPELDAFGYMYTQGGSNAITRKAPVTLTKAVALEPWEGDMQFNANHDMARRADVSPNPTNKEENQSMYKFSLTIDLDRFGKDSWVMNSCEDNKEEKKLLIHFNEKGTEKTIADVEEKQNDDGVKYYEVNGCKIEIEDNFIIIEEKKSFAEEKTDKKKGTTGLKVTWGKGKNNSLTINEGDYEKIDEDDVTSYKFSISSAEYKDKKLIILRAITAEITDVLKVEKEENKYIVGDKQKSRITITSKDKKKLAVFTLGEAAKIKRIKDIISTLKNGIFFSPSGENPGIVPKFIIGAALKIPIPIFHSYVDLGGFNDAILDNDYIVGKVFCRNDIKNASFDVKEPENWKNFLNHIFNKDGGNDSNPQS